MSGMISIRDAYGEALLELGGQNSQVVVLDADVASSCKSILFGESYPARAFNVGIAELNMTAMSAGFATMGLIPFVNTFASFLTTRASDAILSLIAYDSLPVKLAGAYSGLSDAYDGASHQSITDLAFLCAVPNLVILSPCDGAQTRAAVFAAAAHPGPVYLRLSRAEAPCLYQGEVPFTIGRGNVLKDGRDITLIATGTMVSRALAAAERLAEQNISAAVLDIHTIKPLDQELVLRFAKKTGRVLTCEEHSVSGGLGAAVAQLLCERLPTPMGFVGMHTFAESGDYEALLKKYGLDAAAIAQKAVQLCQPQE